MKIDGLTHRFGPPMPKTGNSEGVDDFQKIFEQKVAAGSEVSPSCNAGLDGILEQSERLLEVLDNYARQLASPAMSLKEISPLVQRIEKEVLLLESRSADVVKTDPELKEIIKEMALTANVAVMKFHRGDFI